MNRTKLRANKSDGSTTLTTTQYDTLGRPISVMYYDGMTPNRAFAYDVDSTWSNVTSYNLKGRLATTSSGSGAKLTGSAFTYDAMGRPLASWQCSPSTCGTSNQTSRALYFGWDWAGNLIQEADGGSGTINYGRSVAGEVTSITNATYTNLPYNPPNLVSNVVNGPNGPVTYTLGNGLKVFRGYDPLGRLGQIWVCSGSATASVNCSGDSTVYAVVSGQKGTQVSYELDTVLNQQFSYSYGDGFNRLTARTSTSGVPNSYTYSFDQYGNRRIQNPINGGYASNLTFNSANNRITTSGYNYDQAGNLINDPSNAYTYDAEGNVTQVVNSGGTSNYVYDALNHRVHVQAPSATVDYIFDIAGRRISTWTSPTFASEAKIFWDGQQLGFRAYDGTTYFDHQDVLGTERLRSNYSGAVAMSYSSLPWGDGYTATGNNTWGDQDNGHFAGLERDAESGTEHAEARNYASAQGRWLAPDPYLGSYDLTNPQTFNRYTYALNNPLAFVDPSGLDGDEDGDRGYGFELGCGDEAGTPCGIGGGSGGDAPPFGYIYSGVNLSDGNAIYEDANGDQWIGAGPAPNTTGPATGPDLSWASLNSFDSFNSGPPSVAIIGPGTAPSNGNPNNTYPLLNTRNQNCGADANAALQASTGKILSGDWVGTTAAGVLVRAVTLGSVTVPGVAQGAAISFAGRALYYGAKGLLNGAATGGACAISSGITSLYDSLTGQN